MLGRHKTLEAMKFIGHSGLQRRSLNCWGHEQVAIGHQGAAPRRSCVRVSRCRGWRAHSRCRSALRPCRVLQQLLFHARENIAQRIERGDMARIAAREHRHP